VRNEVLQRVKEKTYKECKVGKISGLVTSCVGTDLLKHGIEGKIEGGMDVTGRRGRRSKKLLDDLKGKRGYRKLKEETLDRCVENSLRNRLWTCRKIDSRMN